MPQNKTYRIGKEKVWALWKIEELEEELSFYASQSCPEEIIHPEKRLEWLASRALLRRLVEGFGLPYLGLGKDEYGKPFLKDLPHYVSIAHSFPFVAAQIDSTVSVGIDLEQPKKKLRLIANRVFHKSEVLDANNDLTKLCIYWCAKESLYKIHGFGNLQFKEQLRVSPFELTNCGILDCTIIEGDKKRSVKLKYTVMDEIVVVATHSGK